MHMNLYIDISEENLDIDIYVLIYYFPSNGFLIICKHLKLYKILLQIFLFKKCVAVIKWHAT